MLFSSLFRSDGVLLLFWVLFSSFLLCVRYRWQQRLFGLSLLFVTKIMMSVERIFFNCYYVWLHSFFLYIYFKNAHCILELIMNVWRCRLQFLHTLLFSVQFCSVVCIELVCWWFIRFLSLIRSTDLWHFK